MSSSRSRLQRAREIPESPVVTGTGTDARTRLAVKQSGIQPQDDKPQTMDQLWTISVHEEKEKHRKIAADVEQRRREHDERVRLAHIAEKQRRAEMIAERDRLLDLARTMQAHAVETDFAKSQILSTCEAYNLTEADVTAVGARLKATGYERIPAMWDYEIRRYLEEKKDVKH